MIGRHSAALAAAALLAAGCSGESRRDPVGLAAEDFPPQTVSPAGVLGGAEVGADSLSDPAIETMGDPFL